MSEPEIEARTIKIIDDIEEANQWAKLPSLFWSCFRSYESIDAKPVECAACETVSRHVGIMLGVNVPWSGDSTRVRTYDNPMPGGVVINQTDFRQRGPEVAEELKQQQEMRRQLESGSLLGAFALAHPSNSHAATSFMLR